MQRLKRGRDYTVDEKKKAVTLTEEGVAQGGDVPSRWKTCPIRITRELNHHINQALKAPTR